MKAEPEVIATTTPLMAAWLVFMIVGFGIIDCWAIYEAVSDWERFRSSLYQRWAVPTMTVLYVSLLFMFAKGVRQYVRHGGRIVWVEDGRLIYYDPSHVCVPCSDIVSLTYGTNHGVPAIGVFTKDGSKKVIRVQGMSISRDEMLRRLQKICGLPDSAVEIPPAS